MAVEARTGFVVNTDLVISETIDDETIIINLNSGSYFSLKHSGATIWALLQNSASISTVTAAIVRDFDVDADRARGEIEKLVARLAEEGLVSPVDLPVGSGPAPTSKTSGSRRPFVAPTLEKFTDMEAMLLLDPIHDVDEAGWPQLPKPASTRPTDAE